MKFIKFFSMALCATMALSFASCSDDDDNDDNSGVKAPTTQDTGNYSQFGEPVLASEAGRYTITDEQSPYASIELTESGRYVILPQYYRNYTPMAKKSVRIMKFFGIQSRADDVQTGSYTKIGENEYLLEGFGTITITGSSTEACEIVITLEDGTETTVGAQPEEVFATDPITLALCRSWKSSELRMRVSVNGSIVTDQRAAINNLNSMLSNMARDMYNWAKKHNMLDEDDTIEDYEVDAPEIADEAIFTKAGSYLLLKDGQLAYSIWAWNDMSKGMLHYSHNVQNLFDPYFSNDATISFDDKNMVAYEFTEDSEDGLTVKYETWSYFVEL